MTTSQTAVSSTRVRRHPIRGLLGGILLGLGVVILLVLTGQAAFSSWVPFVLIFAGCVVFGILVGSVPPARRARPGGPPAP